VLAADEPGHGRPKRREQDEEHPNARQGAVADSPYPPINMSGKIVAAAMPINA